jgi:sugar phosphate isomerase/epimerase
MLLEAGFSSIELSRRHHNIASRADKILGTGIKMWAIHGIASDNTKSVIDEIKRMHDCAMFAQRPYVLHYLNRHNDPVYGKLFREKVDKLLDVALELDFCLAMETAPYKPEVNERYPDSFEIAEFVKGYNSPNLQMTIDINHSNLNENLVAVCENCEGMIVNVHLSDNHGIREEHLIPGEGIINFPEVFKKLRDCGYTGPWNLELHAEKEYTIEELKTIAKKIEPY